MVFLEVDDLTAFVPGLDAEKAQQMIEDAEALALLAAPCIGDNDFENTAAVRAILRGAVVRWVEAGSGAVQSQNVGPFGVTIDTRQQRRGMFWPSEIVQLQRLCTAGNSSAFTIDQMPAETVPNMYSRPDLWFQWIFPVPPNAP